MKNTVHHTLRNYSLKLFVVGLTSFWRKCQSIILGLITYDAQRFDTLRLCAWYNMLDETLCHLRTSYRFQPVFLAVLYIVVRLHTWERRKSWKKWDRSRLWKVRLYIIEIHFMSHKATRLSKFLRPSAMSNVHSEISSNISLDCASFVTSRPCLSQRFVIERVCRRCRLIILYLFARNEVAADRERSW